MTPRSLQEDTTAVEEFAGWSDRYIPVKNTRIENPELLNVNLSERSVMGRDGFTRVNTNRLRDTAARFDGVDDWCRMRHQGVYQVSDNLFAAAHLVLRSKPDTERFVISKGSGVAAARFLSVTYDPTINANGGGWRARIGAIAATVNDGTAGNDNPVGEYRLLQVYHDGANYRFAVLDEAGAVVGAIGTLPGAAVIVDSSDWMIGVDQTAGGARIAGTYIHMTLNNLVLRDHAGAATAADQALNVVLRDLDEGPGNTEFQADLIGYWRFNDGRTSTITDFSTTANHGVLGGEGPQWVTTPTEVAGSAGLEFLGQEGHIHWNVANLVGTGSNQGSLFLDAAPGGKRWAVGFFYVPRMDPDEDPAGAPPGAGVRNQILLWSGTNGTNPAPLGVETVADQLVVRYYNGTTLRSQTITTAGFNAISAHVNKRTFVWIRFSQNSAIQTNDQIDVFWYVEGSAAGTNGFASIDTTVAAEPDPTGVADHWSIARELSAFNTGTSNQAVVGNAAYAILDGFTVWQNTSTSFTPFVPPPPVAFANGQGLEFTEFYEFPGLGPAAAAQSLYGAVPINDGFGNNLETLGAYSSAAFLYPDEDNGLAWDVGLVDPYDAVPAQIIDFTQVSGFGEQDQGGVFALSGTTLYRMNDAFTAFEPVAGNFHKAPPGESQLADVCRYKDILILTRQNNRRPMMLRGGRLDNLGIRAPTKQPNVTQNNGLTGALFDGTYQVAVTFGNKDTQERSNPSPLTALVVNNAGTNDGYIDSVDLPTSTDPQVNQRKLWLGDIDVGPGGTLFLAATIDDNVTVTFGTNIDAVPLTAGEVISSTGYLIHGEAPPGPTCVAVDDRVKIGGDPAFPTRVYYSEPGEISAFHRSGNRRTDLIPSSAVGTPAAESTDFGFNDADLHSGDPIIALRKFDNATAVYFRDGLALMHGTNDTDFPFTIERVEQAFGAAGPHTVVPVDRTHFAVGKRDFFVFNGSSTASLTSPADAARPSIEHAVRRDLNRKVRSRFSAIFFQERNIILVAVATGTATRPNEMWAYDTILGIWARHELALDHVSQVQDLNDDPWVYGTHQGFMVKLLDEDTSSDGAGLVQPAGVVDGGTVNYLEDTQTQWGSLDVRGLTVHWWSQANQETYSARLRKKEGTRIWFYTAAPVAPAFGDVFTIGGIPDFTDWVMDFGSPRRNDKLTVLRLAGKSDGGWIRVSITPNQGERDPLPSAKKVDYFKLWPAGDQFLQIPLGGIARSYRVRIANTAGDGFIGNNPTPTLGLRASIWSFEFEHEPRLLR